MKCGLVSGRSSRSRQKPCPDGLHLGRVATIPNPGVFGGVEHGEPGGDCAFSHSRVSLS